MLSEEKPVSRPTLPSTINHQPSTSRGFTLVEVLAAVLLLSIGLMAIISAMAASRDSQSRARRIFIARHVAQGKVEELRAASLTDLTNLVGQAASTDPSLPPGNSVTVLVARYPDISEDRIFRTVVAVNWPEGRGTRTIRYETLITKY